MPQYRYKEHTPSLSNNVFIAPDAVIIGRVEMGEDSSLWFNCVARGDVNSIHVGKNTNVQDLSMLHVTEEENLVIGDNVSIGHSVTLHSCNIGNNCLIGMGSTILDGTEIGECSLVAAGSLVPPKKKFPPKSFIMGNPAKAVRELTDDEVKLVSNHYRYYVKYKDEFLSQELFELITD